MSRWVRSRSTSLTSEFDGDDAMKRLKVLVVGDAGAGKSTLLYRLEHGAGKPLHQTAAATTAVTTIITTTTTATATTTTNIITTAAAASATTARHCHCRLYQRHRDLPTRAAALAAADCGMQRGGYRIRGH